MFIVLSRQTARQKSGPKNGTSSSIKLGGFDGPGQAETTKTNSMSSFQLASISCRPSFVLISAHLCVVSTDYFNLQFLARLYRLD